MSLRQLALIGIISNQSRQENSLFMPHPLIWREGKGEQKHQSMVLIEIESFISYVLSIDSIYRSRGGDGTLRLSLLRMR